MPDPFAPDFLGFHTEGGGGDPSESIWPKTDGSGLLELELGTGSSNPNATGSVKGTFWPNVAPGQKKNWQNGNFAQFSMLFRFKYIYNGSSNATVKIDQVRGVMYR
jgi:hypothetical protein